jgi:2-polyprenyl-3-methyl-5-hydroxy-6-metoxy-1,4-benzoquinol methylase
MSDKNNTLPEDYFNDVYRNNEDPWDFENSVYEHEKYKASIAALTKAKYQNVFEIGCSLGVLTRMLADRSTKLFAIDVAEQPLVKARERLTDHPQVTFQKMAVPQEFPDNQFDLIVMSEVGYYLSWPDLKILLERITDHLEVNGQLLLVHWTPLVHDYPLTGDEVHDYFMTFTGPDKPLKNLLNQRTDKYRLDLFEKQ